ncbi:MAG: hypothetical protein JWP12_1324 [Bacteroidetes bacterium]|nr:hypothetical protein [Bacteroidota bacterium]
MMNEQELANYKIDISNKASIKQWSETLCCEEQDLIHAVLVIGNSAKIVNDFLILNRQKYDA